MSLSLRQASRQTLSAVCSGHASPTSMRFVQVAAGRAADNPSHSRKAASSEGYGCSEVPGRADQRRTALAHHSRHADVRCLCPATLTSIGSDELVCRCFGCAHPLRPDTCTQHRPCRCTCRRAGARPTPGHPSPSETKHGAHRPVAFGKARLARELPGTTRTSARMRLPAARLASRDSTARAW